MVRLLQTNDLCDQEFFKKPTEDSHCGDEQLAVSEMKNNTSDFFQIRSYYHAETNTRLVYYFVTRVYSELMKEILELDLTKTKPDLIIINSMLYDISPHHYEEARETFQRNLRRFIMNAKEREIAVIWRSSLPLGQNAYGGFMSAKKVVVDGAGNSNEIRQDIPNMNKKAKEICKELEVDYLDIYQNFFEIGMG